MSNQHVYPEGCAFSTLEDIKDKKVTIMGLGLNGGGEACVKFFLKYGAYLTVTDRKTEEQLAATIQKIRQDPYYKEDHIKYVLGEHRIEDFTEADCVIKNPGVKYEGNKYLAAAKAIETDISIFLHFTKAPIIAVTGSKGKSSTVCAIHAGLRRCGFQTYLGGNITVSPLTFLDETTDQTPVVLELSSWQLSDLRGRKALKPKIAIITKIVPDHQNWYGEMDSYIEDKKLIYQDQSAEDFTILDYDEDGYRQESEHPVSGIKSWGDLFASETKGTVLRYSTKQLPDGVFGCFQKEIAGETCGYVKLPKELMSDEAREHNSESERVMESLSVPGEHMKINVLNAALVLYLMKVETANIIATLGSWSGIPHRLEKFYEWENEASTVKVAFFNDSCATVPEAAAAASQSFGQDVIMITGGTDKGLDFLPLAMCLNGENGTEYKPQSIYLLSGTGTDKLTPLLDERKVEYEGPFDSLEVLLTVLKNNLKSVTGYYPIVFSPGATSFGMFVNEFDRGDKFKKYTKEIFV